jgi:hypothetical protein
MPFARSEASSAATPSAPGTALAQLARELAEVPVHDTRTPDDILGHGDVGLPR